MQQGSEKLIFSCNPKYIKYCLQKCVNIFLTTCNENAFFQIIVFLFVYLYCLLFSSRFGIGQRQVFFATFNVVLKNSKSNSKSHVLEGKEGKNLGPQFFGDGLRGYGGPN